MGSDTCRLIDKARYCAGYVAGERRRHRVVAQLPICPLARAALARAGSIPGVRRSGVWRRVEAPQGPLARGEGRSPPGRFKVGIAAALAAAVTVAGGCQGNDQPSAGVVGFHQLEHRPLGLPAVTTGGIQNCPDVGAIGIPGIPVEGGLGPAGSAATLRKGPVYAVLLAGPPRVVHLSAARQIGDTNSWAVSTIWVSRPPYEGPVLVRGGRLDGQGTLSFALSHHQSSGELRLPGGSWDRLGSPLKIGNRKVRPPEGWRVAKSVTQIQEPGCYAFQTDGVGFSYTLAFFVQRY